VNNIHFLSCQEILPNIGSGEQMTRITGGRAKVQQHGYEAVYSKHQILLVDQERMQYAEVEPAKVMNDGRVIVTRFRTEVLNEQGVTVQGPELTMISCYCVSRSSTVKYSDGTDRRELLQTVENAVVSEVNAAVARNDKGYVVVMGDLQEQFDGRFLKELTEAGMVSPMMNRAKEATTGWTEVQKVKGMPTRYPRKGMKGDPTAIDWILVIKHMLPLVDCFGMDNEPNRIYIGSDHIPVFVDLNIQVEESKMDDTKYERFNYKPVAKIKLIVGPEDQEEAFVFDDSQFKTQAVIDDKKLLVKMRDAAVQEEHEQKRASAERKLADLMAKLEHQAKTETWDRDKGELPSRKLDLCELLDGATGDLMGAIEDIMRQERLVRESSIHRDMKKIRKKITDGFKSTQRNAGKSVPRKICKCIEVLGNDRKLMERNAKRLGNPTLRQEQAAEEIQNVEANIGVAHTRVEELYYLQEERQANIEAVEQHRPTDRHERKSEKGKRIAALSEEDKQVVGLEASKTARCRQVFDAALRTASAAEDEPKASETESHALSERAETAVAEDGAVAETGRRVLQRTAQSGTEGGGSGDGEIGNVVGEGRSDANVDFTGPDGTEETGDGVEDSDLVRQGRVDAAHHAACRATKAVVDKRLKKFKESCSLEGRGFYKLSTLLE
jgi:hypothetical protein